MYCSSRGQQDIISHFLPAAQEACNNHETDISCDLKSTCVQAMNSLYDHKCMQVSCNLCTIIISKNIFYRLQYLSNMFDCIAGSNWSLLQDSHPAIVTQLEADCCCTGSLYQAVHSVDHNVTFNKEHIFFPIHLSHHAVLSTSYMYKHNTHRKYTFFFQK